MKEIKNFYLMSERDTFFEHKSILQIVVTDCFCYILLWRRIKFLFKLIVGYFLLKSSLFVLRYND